MAMPNTFVDGFDPAHLVEPIDSDINIAAPADAGARPLRTQGGLS
ncbi:hypothetical protein [Streptomyces sp. NPDC047070]